MAQDKLSKEVLEFFWVLLNGQQLNVGGNDFEAVAGIVLQAKKELRFFLADYDVEV